MLRLHVSNMTCGGCARGVTRAVQSVVADARVEVDLSRREVTVSGTEDGAGVMQALQRAGFETSAALHR